MAFIICIVIVTTFSNSANLTCLKAVYYVQFVNAFPRKHHASAQGKGLLGRRLNTEGGLIEKLDPDWIKQGLMVNTGKQLSQTPANRSLYNKNSKRPATCLYILRSTTG